MAAKRLTSLDGLRGIAALAVVVWHWQHFFAVGGMWQQGWQRTAQPFYWLLKPLYIQGWAAVDLFFVLSGFVFFWLYSEGVRTRAVSGRQFALLRFSRLYPLHLVLLLLVAGMQFLIFRAYGNFFIYQANDVPHFVAHLFMVQNWWPRSEQTFDGPSWSVSIEVLLYLIFFLLCRVGLKRRGQILIVALAGAALLPFDEHIGRGISGFFMGGFVFTLWDSLRGNARAPMISRALMIAALAGWIGLFAMLYADSPWLDGGEGNGTFLLAFDFGLCPLTVLVLALREHLHGRASAPLAHLGDISYATYMIHFPLQLLLALIALHVGLTARFFMQGWVMIAFYAVLIALGTASYRFFERPMQHWIRDRRSRAVAAIAD
ncbi:MAG TPA: acyltransferase [Rhizomicrobium sp.]